MSFALQARVPDVDSLDIHRGATDKRTITSQSPVRVIPWVKRVLLEMGIEIQKTGCYNYRCVRRAKEGRAKSSEGFTSTDPFVDADSDGNPQDLGKTSDGDESDGSDDTVGDASTESKYVLYGKDEAEDPGDEVVFSVQLTRLMGLTDCSLDIRRLKGNLRSYKFIYDTITQRADLCNQVFPPLPSSSS